MSISADIVFADKPTQIATHSPDKGISGFVEFLSKQRDEGLYVCHRLDKDTSGAMVFAKSGEHAAIISKLFEERQVDKSYLLVTDRTPELPDEIVITSEIKKVKSSFISLDSDNPNSKSKFVRQGFLGSNTVWEVTPKTGKPHQIRLHAESLGIPVLGDSVHGGSPFPRLMLHSHKLAFSYKEELLQHTSPLPEAFLSAELISDKTLAAYKSSIERRALLFDFNSDKTNSFRLIHSECSDLRCDKFGEYLWFYWYGESRPQKIDIDRMKALATDLGAQGWKIQIMKNRGESPEPIHEHSTISADSWECTENGTRYVIKHHQGASPGLFLDQRKNRLWVRNNSSEKKVLNLFCYTAGFSICAAQGGAKEVVSVDTSKATLQWAQDNFALNNLEPDQYEFWATDARQFIKGSKNRDRKFDLIICDPPSFARSKKGLFKIESEFDELVGNLFELLELQGVILLSINYEKWSYTQFFNRVRDLNLSGAKISSAPQADLDFEMPGDSPLMKSLFLQKIH